MVDVAHARRLEPKYFFYDESFTSAPPTGALRVDGVMHPVLGMALKLGNP